MIRVDIEESFSITVSLVNELTSTLTSGATVTYDVRDSSDAILSPPVSGTLTESTVTPGIYKELLSIPTSGNYICYANSTGFITSTEEILVSEVSVDNVATLVRQTYHHNISVEDVLRTEQTPNASQTARNVPKGRTDYVITRIKDEADLDWETTTTSGKSYAWYDDVAAVVPYKMGGPS